MKFPDKKFEAIKNYADAYFFSIRSAADSLDRVALSKAAALILRVYEAKRFVWVCGNGGSSAIANHLVCDHVKGVRGDTNLKPRVVSLVSNMETLTAVANDISFEEIFSYQLESLAQKGDILMTISSSGDSENIVRAFDWAQKNGLHTITLTGFSGGRTRANADVNLHVEAENYGIIEDVHQCIMHILAQFIRMSQIEKDNICDYQF